MKKIFIDAGCNNGDTLREFLEGKMFTVYPDVDIGDPLDYDCYAFDVDASFRNNIAALSTEFDREIKFIHSALWTYDGRVKCDMTKDMSVSSSLVTQHNKASKWYYERTDKVPCIDFSKWIIENFSREDFIVLKMDIEAAEFEVLKKMVLDISCMYINVLKIEFHFGFTNFDYKIVRTYYRRMHELLKRTISEYGTRVLEYK